MLIEKNNIIKLKKTCFRKYFYSIRKDLAIIRKKKTALEK